MTYAERFKVRAWLETPAKWLSWAIDSTAKPQDMAYNLQQFWKALEPIKSAKLNTQQWGEVLLLDSRSQSTLGYLYLIQAAQKARDAAVYSVDAGWGKAFVLATSGLGAAALLPKVREFLARNDAGLTAYKASVKTLHDQAQAAFNRAAQMAEQSRQALASSGADATQAQRAGTMAQSGKVQALNSAGQTVTWIDDTAAKAGPGLDLPKLAAMPIAGVPLWVWAAGGLALALVLTTGPTVVSLNRARRIAA
jgi:hypothetical protein